MLSHLTNFLSAPFWCEELEGTFFKNQLSRGKQILNKSIKIVFEITYIITNKINTILSPLILASFFIKCVFLY